MSEKEEIKGVGRGHDLEAEFHGCVKKGGEECLL